MNPQGRRGSSDSNPSSPFQRGSRGGGSGQFGQGRPNPFQHQQQQQQQDDMPLPALEAGVSPIGGVFYSATPTALNIPERVQQQQQQQQQQQGRGLISAPASPSGASSSPTGMRRPSPSKVRKPVFGVKGAYSSMAARRYAAALAASGNADPDVLAEAIQAAAAEAEGSRARQLDTAAAAAGGAGTSRGSPAALRGFGSGPVPQSSTAGPSSSSTASMGAAAMAGQSRQVASLLSPRHVGSTTGADIAQLQQLQQQQQQQQQLHTTGPVVGAVPGPSSYQLSPKTPVAETRPQQGLATAPITWQQEHVPQTAPVSAGQDVPVAQGVMGTQMRERAARVSLSGDKLPTESSGEKSGSHAEAAPQQQQQQQQQLSGAAALSASQGFQSFRINPSVSSSMSPDISRSPSPPYRGRGGVPLGITAAAAAAAATVAASGIVAGTAASGRRSPGRLSPARSASPLRTAPAAAAAAGGGAGFGGAPMGRQGQAPTLFTLEGTAGSATGTEGSGSLLAAQQRLQEPPQAATIPRSALTTGIAFGGLSAAAAAAAAAGPSSRPVDLASGQNSSASSSPLSQQWARPPVTVPMAGPDTGASGRSTPFMTPMGSRSSSFGPAGESSQDRLRLTEESAQGTQQQQELQQQAATAAQQQQQQQQQQPSQGGLLSSLWSMFSGGTSTSKEEEVTAPAPAAAAAPGSPKPPQQQQQRPAGWASPTVAAGAAAAAAAAAVGAGAYAVSGRTDTPSSGHHSLDPVTGLVLDRGSPSRPTSMRQSVGQVGTEPGAGVGSPGYHSLQITPGHTTYLESLDETGRPVSGAAAAGAAAMYRSGSHSPPAGMGHGTAPGHTVFAPGAVQAPVAPYSYSPAVGPGSTNGSGSGIGFINPYSGPAAGAAVAGMLAASAGAAAAGMAAPPSPSTIPAAIPGRFRQITVPDSDVSSMLSYASSVGEPLQPQRLPPVTWPAEALPSPTGSSSLHSAAFGHEGTIGSYDSAQHGEIRVQPSRPTLEGSEGGGAGAGAAAAPAAAGAAVLAAGAAASGALGQKAEQPAAEEQPSVGIKLDSGGGSPRRRSRGKSGATAGAPAAGEVTLQQQQEGPKAAAGARRKSGLGGLFGVSSYEAKRSKAGKQSPEPGAGSSQTPPTAADAPSKGGKCASAARKPRSKKQRIICIVIPLVILAILGGIGAAIGITMSQQKGAVASKGKAAPAPATRAAAPGAAPAVSQPLSFKVNVTLPPDESGAPAPSCSELFSPQADRGKLEKYMFTFKQAYAKALNLDAKDIKVGSLACDGRPVKAPAAAPAAGTKSKAAAGSNAAKGGAAGTPAQAAAPAPAPVPEPEGPTAPVTWSTVKPPAHKRSLMDADADSDAAADTDMSVQALSDSTVVNAGRQLLAVKPAQAATPKPAVLTTEFSVPAPTDATERAELAATVMEMSPAILEAPMTQFFGRPVQVQPAVEQAPAAAPKPAPKPAPKAPAPAVVPSPVPAKAPRPPARKQPKPSPSPAPLPQPQPPAAEAVPETPVEAPPAPLPIEPPESPAFPRRSPDPVAPIFPQKPTGLEPGSPARPVPTVPETPGPSFAPVEPPRAGTWPGALPIVPPRPRWPFGPQRPQPPAPLARPPAPPMPAPGAVGPEEATPVLVTLSPSPPPRPHTYPAPPQTQETFSWPSAPTCHGKPNGHTSTPDAEGRLWGFQDGRSCAFRTPNDQPITITWDNAVSCTTKPTTSNSVFDAQGRLWGFQNAKSCSYRGPPVQAPPAPGQTVITWDAAPSCSGSPDARNSVRNPQGQLWGWEHGKSCAFRIQNGVQKITWATAPVCKSKPNYYTAVRDDLGRLWGWEDNTSCRFSASS